MVCCRIGVGVGALIAVAALSPTPLGALTVRECGIAYKKAQRSGALGGMGWHEFRKARCVARSTTGSEASGNRAAPPHSTLPPGGSAFLPGGRAVFPTAIAPKYRGETTVKGRRQTCLDQYRLNKASNLNGGLKWVEKDGGYYSECNKRLRATAGSHPERRR